MGPPSVSGIVCDTLLRVIRRGAGNESHDLQRDREAGSLDAADDLSRVLLHADKCFRCVAWSGAPATVRRQLQAFDALEPLRRFGSPTRGIEKNRQFECQFSSRRPTPNFSITLDRILRGSPSGHKVQPRSIKLILCNCWHQPCTNLQTRHRHHNCKGCV